MKTRTKSILNVAGAGALSVVMATSAFAAPQRGNDRGSQANTGRSDSRGNDNGYGSYRDNQRMNASGRVTSVSHDRNGYRVQLDRGRESYWIPESRMGNHARDLRVGVTVVFGGVFRGGRIEVDAVTWPNDNAYRNERGNDINGTVERIDVRNGTLLLRVAGNRTIDVDMRDTRRTNRVDFRDLRRGDRVTLSGQWLRNGQFEANGILSVDNRRY
jgi:hypothetical protein